MNLQIINPTEYPGWDDLLLTNDKSFFFHSSSWARVLSESYGYKPLYFTSVDEGKLTTLIPVMEVKSFITGKRGVSLPFTDICPPIVPDSECFLMAIEAIKEYGKQNGWKSIEWRGGENSLSDEAPSSSYYIHTLDVEKNEKTLLSIFRSSTKRNVRKAIREGVEVQIHRLSNSVKQFYQLNCMTRKEHGLPPQPFYFFRRIYEHIILPKKGFIVLASYKRRAIAGAVYFHFGNKAIYKYGASDSAFQHLRANNLVMWEAMKWCIRNEIKALHLGITEVGNQGLRQFKNGWSPREEMAHYYKYNLRNNAFEKDGLRGKTSYALFKKMPSPLLNLIGFLLYRHVG